MSYIKLHRQIQDSKIWRLDPANRASAWIDLLLLASHNQHVLLIKNKPLLVKRGQIAVSVRFLMKRWKWGTGKTLAYLAFLADEQMIAKIGTGRNTIYQIVNYDTYQRRDDTDRNDRGTIAERSRNKTKNQVEGNRRDSLFSSSGSRDIDSSNPRVSSSSVSEKRNGPCQKIFSLWNSKPNLIHHKSLNGQERFIKAALRHYPPEEIETAICRYSEIRSNPGKFRKVYNWTIGEFLSREGGKNIIRFNIENWQEAFMPFGEQSTDDYLEGLKRK